MGSVIAIRNTKQDSYYNIPQKLYFTVLESKEYKEFLDQVNMDGTAKH